VFFAGPNAVAGNGGLRVPLFSPNPWQDGSSVSHLDDAFFNAVDLMMESATTPGPSARTLSAREIGVLRDIGYTMIPEPGAGVFCLVALVSLIRRRRG
jgi:hypothetical protein